ncbi:MAG: hypothetical protein IJC88_05155 [Oscillospiraceae bacterium]|nr:hypothetical protein [Oscillospiraceae bacterium]
MAHINEALLAKANAHKKPLIQREVAPISVCEIKADSKAFQGLAVKKCSDLTLPLTLAPKESVLLDFGEHLVGYLTFSLVQRGLIVDSPVKLRFSFGEFPLEIAKPKEEYRGWLGSGWLQYEDKSVVFAPYRTTLERRYSFRYLLIERMDSSALTVDFTELFATAQSAVSLSDAAEYHAKDARMQRIYDFSVNTLKECEQDVYEDGPKRDRRLWIGDLRLQALTDYRVFRNLDLIRRCIYLHAACLTEEDKVAPCVFPDSFPYVDDWTFADYSLYLSSCVWDYTEHTGDVTLAEELYDLCLKQAEWVGRDFTVKSFIDWCPGLENEVAFPCVYRYTLAHLKGLAEQLGRDTAWIDSELVRMKEFILSYYDANVGLFVTKSGQVSEHSQVWACLSGVLSQTECAAILAKLPTLDTKFTMRTPYMIHYYLEALVGAGMETVAADKIRTYWGLMLDAGFDCCPEAFNPNDDFESPYGAPEVNSACHAWSCTPAYWIPKLGL